MVYTSGQDRLFALPACLFMIYLPVYSLMLHSAASTCVRRGAAVGAAPERR